MGCTAFGDFFNHVNLFRMKHYIMMLLFGLITMTAFGQGPVYQQVRQVELSGATVRESRPLGFVSQNVQERSLQLEGLTKGVVLSFNEEEIKNLKEGNDALVHFKVPVSDRSDLEFILIRNQVFSEDFNLYTSDDPGIPADYKPGAHFKGYVKGDPSSLVAMSVFDDHVMAIVANSSGNMVLGPISHNRENQHVLYHDSDLPSKSDFECGTADDGLEYTEEQLKDAPKTRDLGDCVRVYIEIDDDIVTQKGGATNATNYITGLFNQSIVLYNNESINMMISEIKAWTTPAPYVGSTSSAMLTSYQNNTGAFNGNVSHLVSYQASGGIAVLDGLCASNPDWSKCFSSIDASYQNVPTYSWSVMVVTHEMGHVIGSRHTHACVWNGNNTAIDGCAGSVEGNCPLPGNPAGGGTIMSYCHLTNVGINLSLGFGTQPGNVMRNEVNTTGNCLTSCGPPPPPPPPSYCGANGSNSSYEYINRIQLGSINNQSGNNGGYGNYTNLSTTLSTGTAYTITLTPGFGSSAYVEYWRVWIDYNNDLDFDDSGEQVASGTGSAAITRTFTVPSSSPSVTTRMRVAMRYGAYAATCGSFTYGEVEDYQVVIGGGAGPTCSDGIQNQGETGIDCGGPCTPCATCSDGIQNQGETGVDCGGPCTPCQTASCTDGIQNQGETGVDCGGPCPACPQPPSCTDGIQNQGETGVDCGGPCPACPPPGGTTTLLASYFETGWDTWIDGGSDCNRVNSTASWEGNYSIRLSDNSGTASAMTTPTYNVAGASLLTIQFYFYSTSMEAGEDFWVRYSTNNGTTWSTIATLASGTNFSNNTFYVVNLEIPAGNIGSTAKFRIQTDASDDTDRVYIDAVTITKTNGSALVEQTLSIEPIRRPETFQTDDIVVDEVSVYPNPVADQLTVKTDMKILGLRIVSLDGREIGVPTSAREDKLVDVSQLSPGLYVLMVQGEDEEWQPVRFVKN